MICYFPAIWDEANTVGLAAGRACRPIPMTVLQDGRVVEVVDDGMCGFGWVKIRPANGKFARWLKAQNIGHKAYDGGWDVSVHAFGQSWERKSATAAAMADVLVKHGIDATSHNRID